MKGFTRVIGRRLALCAVMAGLLPPAVRAQTVQTYDDFSGARPDTLRWEAVTLAGNGAAAVSVENGWLVVRGQDREGRAGLASRARLGRRFAIEADALGYEGINQILQVYGGEGDFSHYVEFGIEGAAPNGTPNLHVWASEGPAWEGPAPEAGGYGPQRPLRLRIERDGPTWRFFANGRKVHTLTSGGVGDDARVVLYGFGASTSRWDNVALSGPDAHITAPAPDQPVRDTDKVLDVTGETGATAASWRLSSGVGAYPHAWREIGRGAGPASGRLGRFVPPDNVAGPVTLRLEATDAEGLTRAHFVPVRLARAVIGQPREGQIVGPAFTVVVGGEAGGATRARFFDNGHLKAESVKVPYSARLKFSRDGRHALTVELVDADGTARRIGPVNVTVKRDLYGRYARVADNGRAFVFPDGSVGPIIGHNDSYTWDGLGPLWRKGDAAAAEEYIRTLRSSGVNVVRVMLEAVVPPQEDLLEKPLGHYNASVVRFWDRFIALCERHGMTVLLTPWDTFWINQPWSASPYNAANGGPARSQGEFITSPEARLWQKARLKTMIDRWGNSPAIFAIDLLNEFDIWWNPATPRERAAWVDEMATYVRDYELKKWGHAHMLTVSSASAEPRGAIAETVYRHPLFEFANTHLYYGGTVNDPKDLAGPARSMSHGVQYALANIQDGRPYTDTESGPIDMRAPWLTGDGAFDDEVFRTMSWAHFASGGSGPGMRWPYRFPHILSAGMNRSQLTIAQVAYQMDWRNFRPESAEVRVTLSREGFIKAASADARQAIVWLMREDAPVKGAAMERKPPISAVRLTLSGMAAGRYAVTLWDATTGFPVKRETIAAGGGKVDIALPPIALDIAVTVKPAG